jgi:hypothetical protein
MRAAGISISELWLKYFGMSGDAGEYEVEAYLQGLLSLPPVQRDLLALAANELIDDLPRPRAPYSDDFDGGPGPARALPVPPHRDSRKMAPGGNRKRTSRSKDRAYQ